MNDELGICQAGNESTFHEVFDDLCKTFPTGFTYAEIGIGLGGTLLWAARYLRERQMKDWRVIGIDLPDGYSLCAHSLVNLCARDEFFLRMIKDEVKDVQNPQPWSAINEAVTLVLAPSQAVFRVFWPEGLPLHAVLIDGCHGKACVTGDFLSLESKVEEGGYVLFHDFGPDSVGEPQPHCGRGDTRGACDELRLTSNRMGWKFVKHNIADKEKVGRDLGVFKRIPYASAIPASDVFRRVSGT